MTTKIEKKRRCQKLLKKGIILEEDTIFLLDLIKNHPDYELKEGSGIKSFFIKKTPWNNNGFWIKRIDGSETDFSYIQCLLPRTNLQEIKCACRSAIAEDIIQQREEGYISHHKNIPFIAIFNMWVQTKNIEELELEETKDNQVIIKFKDKCIAEDFRIFHNSIAEIEKVSAEEHKKIHRGISDDSI